MPINFKTILPTTKIFLKSPLYEEIERLKNISQAFKVKNYIEIDIFAFLLILLINYELPVKNRLLAYVSWFFSHCQV